VSSSIGTRPEEESRPMFRTFRLPAVALTLAALVAMPAAAQQQLAMGSVIQGTLTVSDMQWSSGERYDLYTFYGQPGQSVTIAMSATEFDTYLILQDQNGSQLAYNDDGGGGTNSLLQFVLPYGGVYRIVARAYRANAFGSYSLTLSGSAPVAMNQPMPMAQPGGVMGQIGFNQQVQGNLTAMDARWDNKPFQAWQLQCQAGQAFQMDVLSTWDNYAIVFDPMGNPVARDDDSGPESLNARVNHTCTVSGVYRLAVTTYSSGTTPGQYTLQVQGGGMMNQPMAMAPVAVPLNQPQPITQPQAAPGVTMPAPVAAALPLTGSIPAPGEIATINTGENRQGRLETGDQQMNDGTWADVWQFNGAAGQMVTIELRSEEFDTYAQLLDPQSNRLAEDDDSLGDLDSRITFTLPVTGTYKIVVNNFSDERRAGIYTLTLR
jgi:hypothetical protein